MIRRGRLILVDSSLQVGAVAARLRADPRLGPCIAVTAEAMEALDRRGVPHAPISLFADATCLSQVERELNTSTYRIARQLETFLASRLDDCRFDGPGILTGQGYLLQYSASAVLTRLLLMMQTVERCDAREVIVFDSPVDPWFAGDGYARNPWIDLFEGAATNRGIAVEIVAPRRATGSLHRR